VTRSRRDQLIDIGLSAALLAYGLPPVLDPTVNDPHGTVVGAILLPTLVAPVLVRRRWPLGAAAAFAAACVLTALPTLNQFRLVVAIPVALLVLWPVAVTVAQWQRAAWGLGLVLAGIAVVGATESVLKGIAGVGSMLAFAGPLCVAVWGAGRIVWSRNQVAATLAARTVQLQRQRDATAALAVEIDRVQLASELEVAARRRLVEMIALAQEGPAVAALSQAAARERFGRIERLGRDALDQMRELLGSLRPERGGREPRPTLEQLDALVAEARAGGHVVDLQVRGRRRALTAGVELAAFRAVQHALSAVGPEPATVALRYDAQALELEVRGRQATGSAAAAALMAAHERVTALGGTILSASPGGVLRALLPAVPTDA
jgi:signal transduction histidine kinase